MEIRRPFKSRPKVRYHSDAPSLTQQHFKAECDINNIIRRYSETGLLVDPVSINPARHAQFGDFSNIPDMMQAQNKMKEAKDMFMTLPSQVRKQFGNNPAEFVDFVTRADYKQLVELGLAPEVYYDSEGREYYFENGAPYYTGKINKPEPTTEA